MKRTTLACLLGLAAFCAMVPGASAAGLSISPAVVTNDYFGQVTLTITGVSSQAVLVEKFYDLNNNGVVDSGDLLMQSFQVTDGRIPTLGGVTNLNVPGDADGAVNGQIQVPLNYPGLDPTYSRIEGQWLFRVSSPTSAFSAVTQPFLVWQKTRPLSISGSVSNATDVLPNALVVAFDSSFSPVGGSRVQPDGTFQIYTPAGDYTVWPFLSGYLCSQQGGFGSVRPGLPATNVNITMTRGSVTLSGKIKDAVTGAGLAGMGLIAYQTNASFSTAFTDANGNYSLAADFNTWQVNYDGGQAAELGYLTSVLMPSTNLSADTSGFDIPLTPATSLIYGTVSDNQTPSNNLANVSVSAQDVYGNFSAEGMTYRSDGRYSLGVAGGNWFVSPDSGSLLTLGCLGTGTHWILGDRQSARIDMTARKINAHLRGLLSDGSGFPPAFATLRAIDSTGIWSATATTDQMGQFDMGVFGGTWNLCVDSSTAAAWDAVGSQASYTVGNGQTNLGIIYRMRYANSWVTGNLVDENGSPVGGVTIQGIGTNTMSSYVFNTTSDATGSFFASAVNGQWVLTPKCFGEGGLNLQELECTPGVPASWLLGIVPVGQITVSHFALPAVSIPILPTADSFQAQVTGPTNRTFQVLKSANLSDWSLVLLTNSTLGSFSFTGTNVSKSAAGFYKAVAQ